MTDSYNALATSPFAQDWTNTGLITANDDWSGVPSIIGFRGDNLTAANDVDPQTVVANETTVDVNANQTNPNTFTTGGVAEFEIANPVVALQGSGTADAPFLLLHLNTVGVTNVNVSYNLRDIDGSADNAPQQVALQYRVGTSGNFINIPAGYVADASTGPNLATQVTPVSVTLPAEAENQSQVQLRIITTNASGSDEWIGVDDIAIAGTSNGGGGSTPNGGGGSTPNEVTLTPIYTIQGNGEASPLAGNSVTTEGVVVGDFQGGTSLNGFYIQDATGDSDSSTSDGIFVFAPNSIDVNVGDVVQLTGTVSESFNQTQIGNPSALNITGSGAVTPTAIDLPVTSVSDLERYEGMLATFPETLTVTENFNLARFGEVLLSADGRLFNPTNSIDPTDIPSSETENDENNVADVTAEQNLNDRSRILLDDGSNTQNPSTIPFLREGNTLRVGDTTTDLTGVLGYGFNNYRVQPTVAPTFAPTNPRTAAPEDVGGNVKVASFNVLNYFNGDGMGGGFPTSRGASSLAEFERQSDKIVSAIDAIDADVVGLIEIENDGDGENSAIAELVNRLNESVGASTYDYIRDPASGVGTDEIKVAFIYKPDSVTPVGEAVSDTDAIYNRLPVAQTFVLNSTGETFTPVVNHFKSKSGTGTGADADQGDGQGAFNAQRTQQAQALLDFVNGLKTSSGDSDLLVIGDLNAYGEEDPIDVLRNGGLVDELGRFVEDPYSFVFSGQSGRLDHALSSSSLSSQVTDVTEWHINADEPRILDYNLEFKGSSQSPDLYTPTPAQFRASRMSSSASVKLAMSLSLSYLITAQARLVRRACGHSPSPSPKEESQKMLR